MTNAQVEQYINEVKRTILEAQKELAEVKIIRENDPTEFSHLMQQLQQLNEELDHYLVNATNEQQADLREAQKYLQYTQELMERGI
ncbi:DUF2524 family protein [Evansella sp. AB-P1]|uniref:DUF2524 family protein n=1 Tax=Evansella sp. AB-P1 TaxID=3037653 RepID=UPI00241C5B31|nr:DUF2524 family protein [Evansella sp. AB-P1]MDG5787108.1 DUF2524 family protein [Evansella sp. AB-P1]